MGYIALPNGLASRSIPGGYKGGTCRRYGETLNNNSTKLSKVPQRTHAGGGQCGGGVRQLVGFSKSSQEQSDSNSMVKKLNLGNALLSS